MSLVLKRGASFSNNISGDPQPVAKRLVVVEMPQRSLTM